MFFFFNDTATTEIYTLSLHDALRSQMGFRNLGFLGDHLDFLASGLVTVEDVIRERPEVVRATVRAMLKAHRYMQQNRDARSEEHTSELQSRQYLVCRLLLEKKKKYK